MVLYLGRLLQFWILGIPLILMPLIIGFISNELSCDTMDEETYHKSDYYKETNASFEDAVKECNNTVILFSNASFVLMLIGSGLMFFPFIESKFGKYTPPNNSKDTQSKDGQ